MHSLQSTRQACPERKSNLCLGLKGAGCLELSAPPLVCALVAIVLELCMTRLKYPLFQVCLQRLQVVSVKLPLSILLPYPLCSPTPQKPSGSTRNLVFISFFFFLLNPSWLQPPTSIIYFVYLSLPWLPSLPFIIYILSLKARNKEPRNTTNLPGLG